MILNPFLKSRILSQVIFRETGILTKNCAIKYFLKIDKKNTETKI